MRVAVTGASGFVGRRLVASLREEGHEVRTIGRAEHRTADAFAWDEIGSLARALNAADAVVHLAGRAHVIHGSGDELAEFLAANVARTKLLLAAAGAAEVPHVVFASSVHAVATQSAHPLTELDPCHPVTPYGITKLMAETMVSEHAAETRSIATILRLPLVYGPGVKANMQLLLRAVRARAPLPFGRLHAKRSYIGLSTLVAAIGRALAVPERAAGTFFLSDGEDLSTVALVERIGLACARPARLVPVPVRLLEMCAGMADAMRPFVSIPFSRDALRRLATPLQVDASSFCRATGFAPTVSIDEELRAAVAALDRSSSPTHPDTP